MAVQALCSIEGCGKPRLARGWCGAHYQRWERHGDPFTITGTINGAALKWLMEHWDTDSDGCLIWPFARTKGYGTVWFEGRQKLVSRVVCERLHGPPPTPKHQAAHLCGKGHLGCITRNHLVWKTSRENELDRLSHGTRCRGEQNGSKLTEAQVRDIRKRPASISLREIANEFGVAVQTISRIRLRVRWAWLDS